MATWHRRVEDDIPVSWVPVADGVSERVAEASDGAEDAYGRGAEQHRRYFAPWLWLTGALIVLAGVRGLAVIEGRHAPSLAAPSPPAVTATITAPSEDHAGGCPIGAVCANARSPDPVYAAAFQAAFPHAPEPVVSVYIDVRTKQRYQVLIVGKTSKATSITLLARYLPRSTSRAVTGWSFTGSQRQAAGMYFPGSGNYAADVVLVARAGAGLPTSAAAKLARVVIGQLTDGVEQCGVRRNQGAAFGCQQGAA